VSWVERHAPSTLLSLFILEIKRDLALYVPLNKSAVGVLVDCVVAAVVDMLSAVAAQGRAEVS